ncbi:transporter substrate-binding domain-containing protein [Oscillatoriales cyanobacterium LEGE 11467]|uniref:Transporter substrate-binding domain-containing protein n=2 Tax=Zarconia TaxID=2992130 RepID=A0A928VU72_9CYAN|nr:transporter substrate-binding domain-containing protein [Zarconia navalis LEGE 11467]
MFPVGSRFSIPRFLLHLCLGFAFAIALMGVQFLAIDPSPAATFEEIVTRGYLVVAVKDNLRPMGFRDRTGELQGLEIDLARELAEDILGDRDAVVFQPVSNRERLQVVMDGEVDFAIAGVTATAARSRLVDFSLPYYFDGVTFVMLDAVAQDAASITPADLNDATIAAIDGSSTVAAVRYFISNPNLVAVDSYEAGKALLEAGEVDAFAGDTTVLAGWVQEFPQYRLVEFQLSLEPLCVVMPKGLQYDDLRRSIRDAIERSIASGWLREKATEWGLPLPQEEEVRWHSDGERDRFEF